MSLEFFFFLPAICFFSRVISISLAKRNHLLESARKENPSFAELNVETWNDFEKLFGEKGACGGCWCMHWRLKKSEFEKSKGEGNKKKMQALVKQGVVPGVLMYIEGKIAGWCSVAPRENFPVLENSRILKHADEEKVWSLVCFFIAKEFRRGGNSKAFLDFAISYCRKKGVAILEAYPLDVKSNDYPAVFAFTGFFPTFVKAGFKEVERRSETRPILRLQLK